ncbi:MAG: biotin--[acetyl-CoA-carboxylase] ligase [Actinobacteria bacterium]|nr:biotin--[acetyl-CoA-carboxylase] ligase [Actinomycetota bacterium]
MGAMHDPLGPDAVEAVARGRFGRPCRYLPEVGSTNTEALAWAADGADEGAIVVTEHQTAGRGRRGRTWFDEPGTSLLFSLILRPGIAFDRLGLLPVALGTAVATALEDACGIAARTKWPNDVTVRGRKIAGILVETKLVGSNVDIAVAGVGLNHDWSGVQVPGGIADTATSVSTEVADAIPPRATMLGELLAAFELLYQLVVGGSDPAELLDRARSRSGVLGQPVGIRTAEGSLVSGIARDLTADGGLQVETEGGPRVFHVGEVEQLRPVR